MNCGIFRLVKLRQSALLTFAGLASIATTFLFIPALRAQDQPPNLPSFEVTSVKPDTFVPGPGHGRVLELHLQIEAQKLAYSDLQRYVADPKFGKVPVEGMISMDYARERAKRSEERRVGK